MVNLLNLTLSFSSVRYCKTGICMTSEIETFDYIVVGGGSGGCTVASRLSEDPNASVCLLEAGGDGTNVMIRVPSAVAAILPRPIYNWAYTTEPQPGLNGRKGFQPRGKALGGSSAINAMLYIRGHQSDYNHWRELGNNGWGWDEVLPYFKCTENNERGGDDLHGTDGPLNVADQVSPRSISAAFIKAGEQTQYPVNLDFNGPKQEGFGMYQVTQKNGERHSVAAAFIHPVMDRNNLTVKTNAIAHRILIEDNQANGVVFKQDGKIQEIRARKEVILAGGAFASPQLLMLSGIGPGEHLRDMGIEVKHDLPGVGQNLQDHIDYTTAYKSPSRDLFGLSLAGGASLVKSIFEWRNHRTGMLTSPFAEAGAFLKSNPSLDRPDLQMHFVVGIVDDHSRKLHLGHGFSCHICVLRPKSRGSVKLASSDVNKPPKIDMGYFSNEDDLDLIVKGFRMMRQVLEAPALDDWRGKELYTENTHSDQDIRAMIRERADTVYHPVGTCKMGDDEMAVVDDQLRVHGISNLRIADASIMPTLIGGNTNAPTIMIGEKCAAMILA